MVLKATQSYVNALLFTTITEALTVLIFGLLAFEIFRPYIGFFMTLQLGLIAVILWTLYTIRKLDKNVKKQIEILRKSHAVTVPCPDYYVRSSNSDGETICQNGYVTPDYRYRYTFINQNTVEDEETDPISSINVSQVFKDKRLQEVCAEKMTSGQRYSSIPWTSVKPSCQNLDDYISEDESDDEDADPEADPDADPEANSANDPASDPED